jgi:hypothetical protein
MAVLEDYEISELPDGRYEVRFLGGMADAMTFATRAEAEDWVFAQDAGGTDPGVLKPGGGQGVA